MAITGSTWQGLTLGDLVPQLDPAKPDSLASRMQTGVDEAQRVVEDNTTLLNGVLVEVGATLDIVDQLNTDIGNLQKDIEDLISNARETGVFMRILGTDSRINSLDDLALAIFAAFFEETDDPDRPVFVGDTSLVGGFVTVMGAANPLALQDELFRVGTIFPVIRDIVGPRLEILGAETVDITQQTIEAGLQKAKTVSLGQELVELIDFSLDDVPPQDELFPGNVTQVPESSDLLNADGWMAENLTRLIPQLDSAIPGTMASFVVAGERGLTATLSAGTSSVANLNSRVDDAINIINETNAAITELSTSLNDLIDNVSGTGVFSHVFGLDGTLNNSAEFVNAVNASFVDPDDPERPMFAGDTAFIGAVIIVFGTADIRGLQDQFVRLGQTFEGLSLQVETTIQQTGKLV